MPSERPDHRMYEQWHPLGVAFLVVAIGLAVALHFYGDQLLG
jgi:aldehyde dehydrogenase (NAD+)